MLSRLLRTPLGMLVRRIVLLYVVLMLCRVAFWIYNAAQLGPLTWSELGDLFIGALRFDTVSVVYADGLFILLSLLPLHLRERTWYRRIYYVAVNSLAVVAVNLADAVYFRYTQKRFTADEIFFADNDNSLQLAGKFMAENWPLVAVWLLLTLLLAVGYGRKVREESLLRRGWPYYAGGTAILALAAGLSIAGARGGMTRMTRPITLSNATLYTADNGKANLILSNPFCILRTIGNAGSINYKKYFTPATASTSPTRSCPAASRRSTNRPTRQPWTCRDATSSSSSWRACRPSTPPTCARTSTPAARSRASPRSSTR